MRAMQGRGARSLRAQSLEPHLDGFLTHCAGVLNFSHPRGGRSGPSGSQSYRSLKAAPPPQTRPLGGSNGRTPPNRQCPPRWHLFPGTTATCGRGGVGGAAGAGAGIAEVAPSLRTVPRPSSPQGAPLRPLCYGPGRGGGRQQGLCSHSQSAAAAARGPRLPSPHTPAQPGPQLRKGDEGGGPSQRKGLDQWPGAGGPRAALGGERAGSLPCAPALRLPVVGALAVT